MTRGDLERVAAELGLDVVGAAPAVPYEATERDIRERRERGLFADMRFTMAQPELSCHPERLFAGARTVVSAALCYYAPGREAAAGQGRLARYTWDDRYAELREKLDALGQHLGGEYRVLVDANQHVDREGAARAGVGFYGKNTMLITRKHGSWVVLGTLVTDAVVEPSSPLELDCGSCTLCIEACPTGALDEPGVVDSTRCLSYWTQSPDPIPEEYREELGAQVYGCDICQDVCPGNRGVEKRRANAGPPPGAEPVVSLAAWLEAPDEELADRYARLYFPRNDARYLRRNALVAAGALTFFALARLELAERARSTVGLAALAFDTGIIYAYVFIFVFETGTPTVGIVYLAVIEAALRYGLVGGIALPLATFPLLALTEWWRADQFAPPDFDPRYVSLPFGIQMLMGLIVGWLVGRLRGETSFADVRAAEAEGLRDQLGRRADQLEAVNRASRALGSSLDQEHAFEAFIREMKGIFEFERLAVVLATGNRAEVMAVAGPSAERPFPVGSSRPIEDSILEDIVAHGQTLIREDMEEGRYPEEVDLTARDCAR